jgi:transposase
MKKSNKKASNVAGAPQLVIGMDISDKKSQLAIIEGGDLRFETVKNTRDALRLQFSRLPASRVALEAGTHSLWLSRTLEQFGHEVIVANPRKLALITQSKKKSDVRDATILAQLALADPKLLSPIHHRSEESQKALVLIKARDTLVASRTLLINTVRGISKSFGHVLPSCDATVFEKRAQEALDASLMDALGPVLNSLAAIQKQIRDLGKKIDSLVKQNSAANWLRQIHGVGPITALCYVLTIDDPSRFKKSRDVGAYLGLTPAKNQSGVSDPQMHISKEGDKMLRRLLVTCAQCILQRSAPDSALKRHGQRVASQGTKAAKKKAVIAVARKLAVLMHRLWATGEIYEPLRGCK